MTNCTRPGCRHSVMDHNGPVVTDCRKCICHGFDRRPYNNSDSAKS